MTAALPVDIYMYVYGTLKKDFFNYNKYLKPAVTLGKAEFVGAAQTAHPDFFLVLHKDPFVPGMYRAPADGYRVPGEVYKVDTDTLKALDILEGVADKWYQQEKIEVEILDGKRKGETIVCGTYIMPARDDLLMLMHIPEYISEYQEGCETRASPPKLAILQCIYGKEKTDQVQAKIDGGYEFADAWKAVFG